MVRLQDAGTSGGRGRVGGGIGGSFESSGTRVLAGAAAVSDDEPEFIGEVDVDENGEEEGELGGEACNDTE